MTIREIILSWYDLNKRDLPWRKNRSPYSVWVAEIMLQQTRVDTVAPYYAAWMTIFPNIQTLAEADEQAVLSVWEGLGYYSRARSLRKAADIICAQYGGDIPHDPALLRSLPGIGAYTAGAIASIAFGVPVPALDGNIRRILTRLHDYGVPISYPQAEKELWKMAENLLDQDRPGDFNEALMDFGSIICTSADPQCQRCPVSAQCLANLRGTVAERPVSLRKEPIPHYLVSAAVIGDGNKERWLIAQRPQKGLLANLWEFPGGKQRLDETPEECLRREILEELGVSLAIGASFGVYRHAYTHFKVTLSAFLAQIAKGTPQAFAAQALEWVSPNEMAAFPMGKIDRQIARNLLTKEKEIDLPLN